MVISSEKFVFSISANTNFFIYFSFLIGLHIDIVLNIYYICTVFFIIAEMALNNALQFLHAPKIFFQCVQNMFLFFISHFLYGRLSTIIFEYFRMILFFKLKICNMYIFCMIEFLHVYRFDLTHSECNMALIFFSLGMCIVFSCHKFWCFRFFYEHFSK